MLRYRTTVTPGEGLDFVISDDTKDRHGTRINPGGWQFGDYVPVLFGHDGIPVGLWENLRIEKDKLMGRLKLGREGSSDRIDEIRSLVDQGILRAVSAGFEVHDYGKPEKGGYDFERQTLMEASLVAVPSNPNALAQARALELAFGEQAEKPVKMNGGHAATPPVKATKMDSLTPQIEAAQNSLNAARDALAAHLATNIDDYEKTGTLTGDVQTRDRHLGSLMEAERALGMRAAEAGAGADKKLPAPAIARPSLTRHRDTRPVSGTDLLIRDAVVKIRAFVLQKDPVRVLEESYGDHEATQTYVRAAIAGATTTTAGWAAELAQTANADFLEGLRPLGAFSRLAAAGTSLSFGPGAASIKIPSRAATPSIAGSFVAEGGAIPVRRFGLTSITLSPTKMGVLSVYTREMAAYSNPTIEGMLRDEIQNDTAIAIDAVLIDATAATVGLRPAGLRNGVGGLTAATGGGYGAILKDVQALAAPFDTANAGRRLVLMMNPREARALAMSPGPDGTFNWSTGFMGEFTIIVSTTITAGMLIMVDAADFVSVSGAPEFVANEYTTLHMEDTAPGTDISTATPSQSMFQTASVALRMLLNVTWAMRRTGMVQWMTGASWTPA